LQLSKLLIVPLIACVFGAGPSDAATRTAAKKAPSASSKKAPSSKRSATSVRKKKSSRRASNQRRSSPPKQMAPTPERYMEVQQALAEKGYYKGPIDGNWDGDCVGALKRFQEDQNIAADGKLGALSLIALGLGPKREPLQTQFLSKPSDTNPAP
jgi:peptidoglycan hydrolase-like protein with peptidoglycan-binding domain